MKPAANATLRKLEMDHHSRTRGNHPIRQTVVRSLPQKRTAITATALVLFTVSVLVLVTVSPLALKKFETFPEINWSELSNIGQTYGAASALLTGLALIGVAGSLVYQVRAIQQSRVQSSQEHQFHLVEMALHDPTYVRAWGDDPSRYGTFERLRQQYYINLIISFWERAYLVGDLPESMLRVELSPLFRGQAAREFWDRNGKVRVASARSRRVRRFCEIVDEEYRSVASGAPEVPAEDPRSRPVKEERQHHAIFKIGSAALLGAITGAAIQGMYHKGRRLSLSSER